MQSLTIKNENNSDIKPQSTIAEMQKRIETLENMIFQAKEILTLEETAMFIGVTRSQLYKLTHTHAIPYFKPTGKLVYFEKSELLKWLRQNPVKSKAELEEDTVRKLKELAMK